MKEIKSYSYEGLHTLMSELKQPSFRAQQLASWLYKTSVQSYEEMTNLPLSLREYLTEHHPLLPSCITDKQISSDGTRKYIITFHDGHQTEMVAIPSGERLTVCISTQVGCAMGCVFCATGLEGCTRNLLVGEIVEQVHLVQRDMKQRVSNIVIMGQGEPLLNMDNLLPALFFINNPIGLNIAARQITVSTCGVIKGIDRFAHVTEQYTLAVSLHSAIQSKRDMLMPGLMSQSLKRLHEVLHIYQTRTSRRITFEYIMLKGINVDKQDLDALIAYCRDFQCHINLIPYNPGQTSVFESVSDAEQKRIACYIQDQGIPVTLRHSRGQDIAGACGQLKLIRRS